jgi:putative SOS response-associated peptidase YedK
MCSRFEVNVRPRDLASRFDIDDLPAGFTVGEVRPTDPALVIGAEGPLVLNWGLRVDWDKKPLINARAETIADKPTFRPLLKNRCLVPANAYFEWRRNHSQRLKNRIAPANDGVMAFAGLHDGERFVIVTCAPATDIAHIHNRMPVVLSEHGETIWRDSARSYTDVAILLEPTVPGMLAWNEETSPPPDQPDLFSSLA